MLTIHKSIEDEVHRSARLRATYPWFDGQEFASERVAKQIRLTDAEKTAVRTAQSVLHGWVLADPENYTSGGRSPPGATDCWLLALGQVKPAIVVTDDLGMHALAKDELVTARWSRSQKPSRGRSPWRGRSITNYRQQQPDHPSLLLIRRGHPLDGRAPRKRAVAVLFARGASQTEVARARNLSPAERRLIAGWRSTRQPLVRRIGSCMASMTIPADR